MFRRLLVVLAVLAAALPFASTAASAAGDGTLSAFGDAPYLGSTDAMALTRPIVGFAATRSGGYWLVASDGGVFSFGNAGFHGSTGDIRLNQPIVGMAATATGGGYWLVASDGGVFAFGDATFLGSTGNIRLAKPIVGMAATATGGGYWLVASDGGVFAFGDAAFHGSAADQHLARPVAAIAPTPGGGGYWMVAGDGSVYAYGDAPYFGNAPGHALVTGIASTATGQGYWLADATGGVFAFGDAGFFGSASGAVGRGKSVVAITATPSGQGYWVASGEPAVLSPGASGASVSALQSRLNALGYWVPVDGAFGAVTTQALYALQKAAGIPRTGSFDAPTQAALAAGVQPVPRSAGGYLVEVDKTRQLVMIVSNGRIVETFNTSTGNGQRYYSEGSWSVAVTPEGVFHVYTQQNGMRISPLGELWRPKFFTGGYALHGSPSIPPYPASHGCVRLSNAAIDWIWASGAVPMGTTVWVYS